VGVSSGSAKEQAQVKLLLAQERKAKEEGRAARVDSILKTLNNGCPLPDKVSEHLLAEFVRLLTSDD